MIAYIRLSVLALSFLFTSVFADLKSVAENHTLEEIYEMLFFTKNDSFEYYENKEIKERLSELIYSCLDDENKIRLCLDEIKSLYKSEDFRWIAMYLKSLYFKDKEFERMFYDENSTLEDIFMYDFLRNNTSVQKEIVFAESVGDIFKNPQNISAYIADSGNKDLFLELLRATKNQLDLFIDNHFDLPGRGSLVRKGLIKKFKFNDQVIIAKKNNPAKKGRFLREQENIEKLKGVLGISDQTDCLHIKDDACRDIKIKVLSPFAVFSSGDSSKFYSLTFFQSGTTLEEILLVERDAVRRKNYLKDMRLLLEFLYQNGVVWGDMSPRNIIVEESGGEISYIILDFEKTAILNRPVSMHERVEHARGPMCVEEFGAICTEKEVIEAFSPYFNPTEWDLESREEIPFAHPKDEVIAYLKERSISEPTFGEYNRAEKEIMQVRFFDNFSNYENSSSLISLGFRIFHYLGSEYDMKTTEILLCSKKYDLMQPVLNLLDKFVSSFENALILRDFEDVLHGVPPSLDHKQNVDLELLARLIDALYQERDSQSGMSKRLAG
ncbi:MAG: hypothetical protein JSS61_00340 [Verrucomicrobia bacterium]|nr:hypothetical protein [Verrucomicrobiota bacterium]